MSEPYVMGSHAFCAGAWASGPEDLSPPDYKWGYNRMTTIEGSLGQGIPSADRRTSFHQALSRKEDRPAIDEDGIEQLKELVFAPLENYDVGKNMIVARTVAPNYFYPYHGLSRLEKIMDEYAGGVSALYTTNAPCLKRALDLILILKEDLAHLGAENLHHF
jgi:adenylylsulfate reductase subunit A